MGLDGVEIVMGWEQAFGISITDAEAMDLRTPRMAIDLVCKKLGVDGSTGGFCLSQRAFYRLRRAFGVVVSAPRAAVKPDTKLADLLPWRNRSQAWQALSYEAGLNPFPNLTLGLFPVGCRTVADLCRSLASWSPGRLLNFPRPWTRQQVREAVRATVIDVLCIKEFSDDADFVYDLRID